ncbi:uncharacterized protein LOC134656610 [Cydia amplana]|uniref:uncharacterized protein LOC134656610 n=1 Tax=Cydia amplana TaxID=1869771 RepID=UPI002FE60620
MTAWFLSVACCLLASRVSAAPASAFATASSNDEVLSQSTLLHTADHDVTSLGVLFGEGEEVVFFIESDVKERGERVDYGLYALTKDPKSKRMVSTKLLDSARDIAVASLTNAAYFAAKDGIYVYDKKKNSAEKYGSVSDDVISIAAENGTGVLYYVNKQHQLYKVSEGQKPTIIDAVKNAEQFTLDKKGHLYFYTTDKKFYVYDGQSVKPVEGIPSNLNKVWFVRTPLFVEDYCLVNGEDEYYQIWGNATAVGAGSSRGSFAVSALSVDTGFLAYFATDRKIYEFNVLAKVVAGIMDELSKGLKPMLENIRPSFSGDINTFAPMPAETGSRVSIDVPVNGSQQAFCAVGFGPTHASPPKDPGPHGPEIW